MWIEMEKMRMEERRKKLQPRTSVRKDAACNRKLVIKDILILFKDFHLDFGLWQVEKKNRGKSPKRISPGERRLLGLEFKNQDFTKLKKISPGRVRGGIGWRGGGQ